jgi:hypothetical protein
MEKTTLGEDFILATNTPVISVRSVYPAYTNRRRISDDGWFDDETITAAQDTK